MDGNVANIYVQVNFGRVADSLFARQWMLEPWEWKNVCLCFIK